MAVLIAPTKSNLIKAKSSLALSKKGFELLDKKRNVLIKEMMDLVDKAKKIQSEI
jgi:V/A-type H+-transporting ATPase subunit D